MEGSSGQMDRKTINSQTRKQDHPYQEFEASPTWKRVDRAISALVKNGDIQETTRREYIVGYICKMIGTDAGSGRPRTRATTRKAKG
jgi:hypothetical protein